MCSSRTTWERFSSSVRLHWSSNCTRARSQAAAASRMQQRRSSKRSERSLKGHRKLSESNAEAQPGESTLRCSLQPCANCVIFYSTGSDNLLGPLWQPAAVAGIMGWMQFRENWCRSETRDVCCCACWFSLVLGREDDTFSHQRASDSTEVSHCTPEGLRRTGCPRRQYNSATSRRSRRSERASLSLSPLGFNFQFI